MYHNITSSIRSKIVPIRPTIVFPTTTSSLLNTTVSSSSIQHVPQQQSYITNHYKLVTTAHYSFFATTGTNDTSSSSQQQHHQKRPFWATTPSTAAAGAAAAPKINHVVPTPTAEMMDVSKVKVSTKQSNDDTKTSSSSTVPKMKENKTTPKTTKKTTKKVTGTEDNDDDDDDDDTFHMDKDFLNAEYLTRMIAKKNDLSLVKSKKIVTDMVDMIIDGIIDKKCVRIARLGVLQKKPSKERVARNIRTKELYTVPAKYRISFKVSSVLKQKIQELPVPKMETK